ncbi:MAG: transcriptional regulator [Pseudomonadota bacterium]
MLTAEKHNKTLGNRMAKDESLRTDRLRQSVSGLGTFTFFLLVAAALYEGWRISGEHFITAENGLGYALGIIGGVMMLLLLIYPLRKRKPSLRFLGGIKHWFRLHMIFGVLGPSAILFHCNFELGALNSNIALFCMVIVASSGLLGRYFYSKIHHGLYGSRASVQGLQQDANRKLEQVLAGVGQLPRIKEELHGFETAASQAGTGMASIIKVPLLGLSRQLAYVRIWRQCKQVLNAAIADHAQRRQQLKLVRHNLRSYFRAVQKGAELGFYARLFSLWHVLHLPLFIMMLITGIIHVIAVHMY